MDITIRNPSRYTLPEYKKHFLLYISRSQRIYKTWPFCTGYPLPFRIAYPPTSTTPPSRYSPLLSPYLKERWCVYGLPDMLSFILTSMIQKNKFTTIVFELKLYHLNIILLNNFLIFFINQSRAMLSRVHLQTKIMLFWYNFTVTR